MSRSALSAPPAILTQAEVDDALAGVAARLRHRDAKPSSAKRLYLLRGLAYCSCGARLRGDTRIARGREWKYMACPVSDGRSAALDADGNLVVCHAGRVPALEAERYVIEQLTQAILPAEVIEEASAEVRRRLAAEVPGTADRERARLVARLSKLASLFSWGDMTEVDYRAAKAETEAALAAIPAPNERVVEFDRYRDVVTSLPDTLAGATPEAIQPIIALLVERVDTADREVTSITWVPAARPFFTSSCVTLAPPDGFEPPTQALGRPRSIH
jgi:hypothetical protein